MMTADLFLLIIIDVHLATFIYLFKTTTYVSSTETDKMTQIMVFFKIILTVY